MDDKKLNVAAIVKQYGGWMERSGDEEIARFPSVHQRDQFVAAMARATVAMGKEVRIHGRQDN